MSIPIGGANIALLAQWLAVNGYLNCIPFIGRNLTNIVYFVMYLLLMNFYISRFFSKQVYFASFYLHVTLDLT